LRAAGRLSVSTATLPIFSRSKFGESGAGTRALWAGIFEVSTQRFFLGFDDNLM
jgi:hypothetical protein